MGSPILLRFENSWVADRDFGSERFSEDKKEAQGAMIEHFGLHFSVRDERSSRIQLFTFVKILVHAAFLGTST